MKSEAVKLIELADSLNEAGASLSQIKKILDERTCCLISAYREEYSRKENEARRKELSSELRSLGYGFINLKGVWTDTNTGKTTTERSCLVINTLTPDEKFIKVMLALMNEFNQNAIVIKVAGEEESNLYFDDGTTKPFAGKFRTNGVEGSEMLSFIQGRPFKLDESGNNIRKVYYSGGVSKMAEQAIRSSFLKKHENFLKIFVDKTL